MLSSALPRSKEYNDSHLSENLCNVFIFNLIVEWQILCKVAVVIHDNIANIIGTIRWGEWRSLGCLAYLLNLIQIATSEISDSLTKVKNIKEFLNKS